MFVGSLIVQSIRKILMLQTKCENLHGVLYISIVMFSVFMMNVVRLQQQATSFHLCFFQSLHLLHVFSRKANPPNHLIITQETH